MTVAATFRQSRWSNFGAETRYGTMRPRRSVFVLASSNARCQNAKPEVLYVLAEATPAGMRVIGPHRVVRVEC